MYLNGSIHMVDSKGGGEPIYIYQLRSTSFKNHQNELCCLPNGFHWPHETHPGFKMEVGTKVKQITF